MADVELEEIESLQREFEWVLTTEVKSVLKQLKEAVKVSFCEVLTLTVLPKCFNISRSAVTASPWRLVPWEPRDRPWWKSL